MLVTPETKALIDKRKKDFMGITVGENNKRGGQGMFMILNAAVLSLWITSIVAFVRCYRRHTKEEKAQGQESGY